MTLTRSSVTGTLLAVAALAAARGPAAAQVARPMRTRSGFVVVASIGGYFEDNERVGDESLLRLPIPLALGLGSPRSTQIEIEPSAGWHNAAGATDASGVSYTRFRFFHFFGPSHRVSVGPDLEIFFKTESNPSLGYGFTRVMPGIQAAVRLGAEFRAIVRARYEFSGGEDPGVSALSRIVMRSTVYFPPAGRFTSWARSDLAFDLHGAPNQYNVEASAGLRLGPARRLTVFVQPRLYVGAASRTRNLWRLRTGAVWSLGNVVVHHAPHESDFRRIRTYTGSPAINSRKPQ